MEFVEILAQWRADGAMAGLECRSASCAGTEET
jgi:hypothetical protein